MEGCLVIVESPTEVRQRPVALVSLATAVWLGTCRSWQGPAIRNAASQKRPDAPSQMDEARKWLWSSTLLASAAAARQSAAAKLLLSRRGGEDKRLCAGQRRRGISCPWETLRQGARIRQRARKDF